MLLFAQLAGLLVPFVLLLPLTTPPQDYLVNAVGASFPIKVAAFLLFANCALTIGISIAAFRVFRQYSEAVALWLLAVSVIMFVLQAIDNVHVLSMLSLSQRYTQAGGLDELYLTLAAVVGSTRRWAHLTELLAGDMAGGQGVRRTPLMTILSAYGRDRSLIRHAPPATRHRRYSSRP